MYYHDNLYSVQFSITKRYDLGDLDVVYLMTVALFPY